MIPLAAGQAREDETILRYGFRSHAIHRFVHPDRPRLIGPRQIGYGRFGNKAGYQAAPLITAPSMTTPWVTYFHKATRSLRASATIARLRPRWPCAWNQRARADCGW